MEQLKFKLMAILPFCAILLFMCSCQKDSGGNKKGETEEDMLNVSSDVILLSSTSSLEINTNNLWTLEIADNAGESGWFQLGAVTGKAGKSTVAVTQLKTNSYSDERSSLLKLSAGSIIKYITVIQKPTGSLINTRDIVSVPEAGGSFSLSVNNSSGTLKIEVPTGSDWLTAGVSSVSTIGESVVNISAQAGKGRKGIIRVSNASRRDSIVVYQKFDNTLAFMDDTISSFLQGGILNIDLMPGKYYTVSIKESLDWIRVFQTSSPRIDRKSFQIDPNKLSNLRIANLKILDRTTMKADSICINQFFFDDIPFLKETEYGIYDYSNALVTYAYSRYNDQMSQYTKKDNFSFRIYNISNKKYCSFEDMPSNIVYGASFTVRVIQNFLTSFAKNRLLNVTVIQAKGDKIWLYDTLNSVGIIIKR